MQANKQYKAIIIMGATLIVIASVKFYFQLPQSDPFTTMTYAIGILMVAFGLIAPHFKVKEVEPTHRVVHEKNSQIETSTL